MDDSYHYYIEQAVTYGVSIVGALVILIVGWITARLISNFVRNKIKAREAVDPTIAEFAADLTRYVILAFVIIAVLNQFGIQTASLIAIFGAAGLAIGLAMQGTLSDLASGVMLLIFRPFKIGDYVEAGGQAGTIHSISLFVTKFNTPDNVHIIAPNSDVWGSAVKNYSHNDTRRVDIVVGIAYDANIDQAMNAARDVMISDARTLDDPEPFVAVSELADSSVNLVLRVWCSKADYWPVKFDLTKTIKERLDAEEIEIPFPQRTVHLLKEDD